MRYKNCTLLFLSVFLATAAFAQSLTQQASTQFRAAEKAEAALYEKAASDRERSDYLRVIRAYERVYLITPHTGWADNALTSIARLYEEMKDPRNAVKTLQFLVHEYPQTPFKDVAERDIARLSGANEVTLKETASVENIRFWEEDRSVRVVIDIAGNVTYKTGEAYSPSRFYVDISPARLNSMLSGREWVGETKLFDKIRVAQYDGSTVRVVLDGPSMKNVTTFNLKDPNRIIMDLAGPTESVSPRITSSAPTTPPALPPPPALPIAATPDPVAAAPEPSASTVAAISTATVEPAPVVVSPPVEPASVAAKPDPGRIVTAAKPTTSGDRSLIRSLGLKLSRVVVDAGHGGHDTGSIGPSGFTEKELVLDIAKRLRDLIEHEMGAEVVMTRSDDSFVALESRTQIANDQKADLFISIHANSSPTKSVRGVETFFLNLNTQSRDALATAARENAASEKKIHELQDILQKIVLNDKTDESRELAEHVQVAMSKRSNAGTNRGVKQAPFVVLIGASMPSILSEINFISNPEEEKRLKTAEYRQQIAEALFQGIQSYAETLSSTKAAN